MHFYKNIFNYIIKSKISSLKREIKNPFKTQELIFKNLITVAKKTFFGKKFNFSSIKNMEDFNKNVPIFTYETIYPYINLMLKGKSNILWPSSVLWFSKSSGTTNSKSKFIPVSKESLWNCHYKAGQDIIAIYMNNNPDSKLFFGNNISLGGVINNNFFHKNSNIKLGDISAIIMKNLPFWIKWYRFSNSRTSLIDNWQEKINTIASIATKTNITSITGSPVWVILLIEKILKINNKKNIHEIWPMLELYIHGAVSILPYKSAINKIILNNYINYMEVYNSSEGFFAIQDRLFKNDMLLLLNHGIFYEFILFSEIKKKSPKVIRLDQVIIGLTYILVISTNSGLWRYIIGDTIRFTSINPFRIKIIGRTKNFINVFGEELVIENSEFAISKACKLTNSVINNYTVAPYFNLNKKKGHEWIIEFIKSPKKICQFVNILDSVLKNINSDYASLRFKNIILSKPIVHVVSNGIFYKWIKSRGSMGFQNKIPRLLNTRKYINDLLFFNNFFKN